MNLECKSQTRNAWTPVITDRDSFMKVVQGQTLFPEPAACFGFVRDSLDLFLPECPLH